MNTLKLARLAKNRGGKITLNVMASRWDKENWHCLLGDPVYCALKFRPMLFWFAGFGLMGWLTGFTIFFVFNVRVETPFFFGFVGMLLGFLTTAIPYWISGSSFSLSFKYPFWLWKRSREFCRAVSLIERYWTNAKIDFCCGSLELIRDIAIAILKEQAEEVKIREVEIGAFLIEHSNDLSWEKIATSREVERMERELLEERKQFKRMFKRLFSLVEIPSDHGFYYGNKKEV